MLLTAVIQLFLEEERERELETLYESGVADALNAPDTTVGGGENGAQASIEATAVTKQTTDTLMAGERIMEALDLADGERAMFREYEEEISRMSADAAIKLQPPPRNPVLAAYDIEPEAWVLRVVEKVQSTALQDALLVLPFGKVVSLMEYLKIWAQKVCDIFLTAFFV
jgi:U3 small nucleolar RNA-associated protein 12